VPHEPQCAASVSRFVSHPLAAIPSQSPKPASHVSRHTPSAQDDAAFATTGQVAPQAPQFVVSLWSPASQPSALTPLQSPKPGAHAKEQFPAAHPALAACAGVGQGVVE